MPNQPNDNRQLFQPPHIGPISVAYFGGPSVWHTLVAHECGILWWPMSVVQCGILWWPMSVVYFGGP